MPHKCKGECEAEWRNALFIGLEKNIQKMNKKTPGQQCPFCGTNPSKVPYGGLYFRDFCGHEIRKNGLVTGWIQRGKTVKCVYPEKTRRDIRKANNK